MIQAIIKKGHVLPVEVPVPMVSDKSVLIKVVNSCISAGTEISSVQNSGKSLIRRAMEQPEKIKQVFNMAKNIGIDKTFEKIRRNLEIEKPTGYSLSGIVIGVANGIKDLQFGDRVVAAGAGFANHAEYVDVPRNLVIPIPDSLSFRNASTVALGGIAMQGIRRAKVAIGEFVVVFGTGILGQLAVQMLCNCGVRVIAIDLDERRLKLAKDMGAEICLNPEDEDSIKKILHHTNGHGADVVLFSAATNNSQSLSDAFAMTRKKGRLVMIGVWGSELKREDMYAKELDFLISTSYGPGRYDSLYEEKGLDYPYAYVRWTESRNMEEYLRLLSTGQINLAPLIHETYPFIQVEKAFKALQSPDRPLIVILDYGTEVSESLSNLVRHSDRKIENRISYNPISEKQIRVGIIGAGNFVKSTHIPNLQTLKNYYEIRAICNRTSFKAHSISSQCGAKYCTTDYQDILNDNEIDLVMICTRHNLHGKMVLESLNAGKHTFVEKPLCISQAELDSIKDFYNSISRDKRSVFPILMVGFNRRFSQYIQEIKKHIVERINPLFIHYRMNAGYIPLDHWVHSEEGGGRIIGEACHIIDLFSFLVGSPVVSYGSVSIRPRTGSISGSDNKSIILKYEDGSVATLEYFAIGSGKLPKEYMEVHFDEKTIIMEDYKSLKGYGVNIKNIQNSYSNKGQLEELNHLYNALKGNNTNCPIELWDMIQTTEICLNIDS